MIICFKDISEKGFCSIILLRSLIPLKISYGRAQTKSKIQSLQKFIQPIFMAFQISTLILLQN